MRMRFSLLKRPNIMTITTTHAALQGSRGARQQRSRGRALRRGLSLVELMISLAISVMLLTAVAAAFHSTTTAIEVNDRFFRASQTARIAMTQMTAAVRQSDSCQVGTSAQQSGDAVNGATNLDIITPAGRIYSYVYAPTDRELRVVLQEATGEVTRVLARNVVSCSFDSKLDLTPKRTVRVNMTLVVQVDGQRLLLSGSAVPRREMVY